MAELVDAHGSGPCAARCGGSSPSVGTRHKRSIDENQSAFCVLGSTRKAPAHFAGRARTHVPPRGSLTTRQGLVQCMREFWHGVRAAVVESGPHMTRLDFVLDDPRGRIGFLRVFTPAPSGAVVGAQRAILTGHDQGDGAPVLAIWRFHCAAEFAPSPLNHSSDQARSQRILEQLYSTD